MSRIMITAMTQFWTEIDRDLFFLQASLRAALEECRARKRDEEELRQALGDGVLPDGWLGSLVGGRIFNGVWGLESGDVGGSQESRDPGEGGVLQPGDPGYGGNVLEPGDPGAGG